MWHRIFDTRLRSEAMRFLAVRTNDGLDSISRQELLDFSIDGEMFRLMDLTRGIRKPRQLASALSISRRPVEWWGLGLSGAAPT